MSRFKAGDLALVVASRWKGSSSNIGKSVEVIGSSPDGDIVAKGDLVNGYGIPRDSLEFLPSHLMPLRGDFTPEQSKEQERPVNA